MQQTSLLTLALGLQGQAELTSAAGPSGLGCPVAAARLAHLGALGTCCHPAHSLSDLLVALSPVGHHLILPGSG